MNPQRLYENVKRLMRVTFLSFIAISTALVLSYVFSLSIITTALLSLALATSFEACYQVVSKPRRYIPRIPRTAYSNLTPEENDAINDLRQRYTQQVQERGVDNVLQDFKNFLEEVYRKKPVRHNGRDYPLEYQAGLPPEVLKIYHQHVIHSAHRYLFQRPNHFMYQNSFFKDNVEGGYASTLSLENKEMIAMMWLAANDEITPLPPGFTKRRQLLKSLALPLHELNRLYSSNDNEGDNPSCPKGGRNRFAAHIVTLLNHLVRGQEQAPDVAPEQRELTPEIIRQRFVARVLAKEGLPDSIVAKLHRLNLESFAVFEQAFENLINFEDLTQEQQDIINRVQPSPAIVDAFIQECQQEFGTERITQQNQQIPYPGGDSVTSYEALIRRWAQNPDYILQFGIQIKAVIDQGNERAWEVDEFPNPPIVHQFQQGAEDENHPANDEAIDGNPEVRRNIP